MALAAALHLLVPVRKALATSLLQLAGDVCMSGYCVCSWMLSKFLAHTHSVYT